MMAPFPVLRSQPAATSMSATEEAINNTMARGFQGADQRFNLKATDRAGLSRGKAQQFVAAQGGVQAMSNAAGQAAQMRSEDDANNAQMRLAYDQAQEQEAQNIGMYRHSRSQSDWASQFARQQAAAQAMAQMSRSRAALANSLMYS
jgi:hypothetical protein